VSDGPAPPPAVQALLAAFAAQDEVALRACCAPDLHFEDPLTEPLDGVDAFVRHVRVAWKAFPDGRVEATGPAPATGSLVAVPCKLVATHRGRLGLLLPATGRFLIAHAVLYCEQDDDGLLWRMRAFYDVYGAATQLGVLPKPGTAAQRALLLLQGFGAARR
jgi:hypothetical protein